MSAIDRPDRFRARTAPEIVDAGVQLARRNFGPLFRTAAIPLLPYLVIDVYGAGDTSLLGWELLVAVLCASVADAAVAHAAAEAWHGRAPDAAVALRATGARLWPVLAAGVYRAVVVVAGLCVLIVPGLMAFAIYALVPGLAVLEPDRDARAVLRRSRELTAGWRRHAAACYVLPYLFAIACEMAVGWTIGEWGGSNVIGGIAGSLVAMVLTPFVVAIQVVLYFDLRVRKEAYDIESMLAAGAAAA